VERLRIHGRTRLAGEVTVAGAKNSALKLMAAALLTEGRTVLSSVPDILDVRYMGDVLERLGCTVDIDGSTLALDVPATIGHEAPYELVRRLRASITVLGPLVARCGRAKVALPGGDSIGSRGLGMHVAGLAKMGAETRVEHGYVVAEAPHGLHGCEIILDFPSVGATENLLLAATLAEGSTLIDNVAREPEIVDIAEMLTRMGAKIGGIGTSTLEIEGPATLHAVQHEVVPDRMVAGTWAIGAAVAGGRVTVRNARAEHLEIVLDKLDQAGATVDIRADGFTVRMDLRTGAGTPWCRRTYGRTPRGGSRQGDAVRRARRGDGHPGRRRAGAGRPCRRRRDNGVRSSPPRPRLSQHGRRAAGAGRPGRPRAGAVQREVVRVRALPRDHDRDHEGNRGLLRFLPT
jgi:UDP-N-acetylglucosamine 1-carboxyvinyltransferase